MTDEDRRQAPLSGTLKEISDALMAPVPIMRRGGKKLLIPLFRTGPRVPPRNGKP